MRQQNQTKVIFFIKIYKTIKSDQKTILAGDFNMTENIFLDRIGGNPNNTHTFDIQDLNCIKNKNKLIDMEKNKSI